MVPGIILTVVMALLASWLGQVFPLIGGPVFAIIIGAAYKLTLGVSEGLGRASIFP